MVRGAEPYGGVFDAAGEGDPTPLPAGVVVGAVEVDIEVPVVGAMGSAARPLWRKHIGGSELVHFLACDLRRPLKEGVEPGCEKGCRSDRVIG